MPHPIEHWLFLRMDPELAEAERVGTLAKMRALADIVPMLWPKQKVEDAKHIIDEIIVLCEDKQQFEYSDVAVRLSALNELWPAWLSVLYDSRLTYKERGDG